MIAVDQGAHPTWAKPILAIVMPEMKNALKVLNNKRKFFFKWAAQVVLPDITCTFPVRMHHHVGHWRVVQESGRAGWDSGQGYLPGVPERS